MEKEKKSKKKLIIVLSIISFILITGIITTIIVLNKTETYELKDDEENETVEKTTEEKIVDDFEKYIGVDNEKGNYSVEKNDNNKYIVTFNYNKKNMYLHVCASDSQTFAKRVLGKNIEENSKIESIKMNCKENGELKYIIIINNYQELTEDNLESNTIIQDKDGNNMNKTVTQAYNDYINEYKNECKTYNYKTIFRYVEEYKGKKVKYTGKVVQVIEGTSVTSYRVNVTKDRWGYYDDTIYVTFMDLDKTTPRILEDDIITFYGILGDLYTYETVMGASVTIPSVTALYIDIK